MAGPAAALGAALALAQTPPAAAAGRPEARPHFILVLTDDQSVDTLEHMPRLAKHLTARGTTFPNAFGPVTACRPSRISILRGQYVHSHGVVVNQGPGGGYEGFRASGLDTSTLATWLQSAGYRTALVGQLERSGALERTVIVFASDSGFHLGQHRRFRGKGGPYEEDVPSRW
ncbi:MAG: sulfatase-like hydrolase/transferase [Myxococcota bacterium]